MRRWATLQPGYGAQYGFDPRKILLYTTGEGTYVFLFDAEEALFSRADEFYDNEQAALEAWEEGITAEGWHFIDDPLPGCQHDCILPIRVKGRNEGNPRWGEYELLEDGEWKDIREKE